MKQLVRVFEVVAVVASLAFVLALFLNEPDDPAPADVASESPDTGDNGDGDDGDDVVDGDPGEVDLLAVGRDLYGRRCGSCHGGDGQGALGPALGGGAVVAEYPDPADQARVIREGQGGMPGFSSLTDTEIEALVVYTREELPG